MTDSHPPEVADRHSLGVPLSPMPEARRRLALEREFSQAEFEQISRGLIPRSMDDRWLIFLEGSWLYFHRSWTPTCIFQCRFAKHGSGYLLAEAWVNRDPGQYGRTDDAYDTTLMLRLIDDFLLEKWKTAAPRPEASTETSPCPYCGEPLRTATAKQCRFCRQDWHDLVQEEEQS